MTTQFISSEPPAIRRESDVIAYAATTLGYWPHNSLAVIIAQQRTVGPVLRIDVDFDRPNDAQDIKAVLTQTFVRSPGILDEGGQLFAVFFGKTQHPRNKNIKNPMEQLALDQDEAEKTAPFVHELHRFAKTHGLTFADALFVGADTFWGILYPAYQNVLVGNTQEILESPLSIYMIAEGKRIDDNREDFIESSLWNPYAQSDDNKNWFHEAQQWFETYRFQNSENKSSSHAVYRQTAQSQLAIWEFSIDRLIRVINDSRAQALRKYGTFDIVSHLGSAHVIKNLTEQISGYLAATLTESTFIHQLLYLAMTSQRMSTTVLNSFQVLSDLLDSENGEEATSCILPVGTGQADIEKLCLELLDSSFANKKPITKQAAMRNLDKIAKTISGNANVSPNWQRIDALEIICLVLVEVAHHHEKYNVLVTLAWISWLKGKSSQAARLLEQAQDYEHTSEPILLAALQTSSLPAVALNPETSWSTHFETLNNPRQN